MPLLHWATSGSSVRQLPSELCDVSFPSPFVKGSPLAVRTPRRCWLGKCPPARGQRWQDGGRGASYTCPVWCGAGCGSSHGEECTLVPAEPPPAPVLPSCKAGMAEYDSHPASLKGHIRQILTSFFLPYLDSGERRRNPATFPAARGAERNVLSTWVKR